MLLRSPDFGNTFKLVTHTRIHRIVHGDLRTLQGNAPVWEGFSVHFSALTLEQINDFKTFVAQNMGRQIELLDFENRTWLGIITSSEIPIINGRNNCDYQTEFEFEGTVL